MVIDHGALVKWTAKWSAWTFTRIILKIFQHKSCMEKCQGRFKGFSLCYDCCWTLAENRKLDATQKINIHNTWQLEHHKQQQMHCYQLGISSVIMFQFQLPSFDAQDHRRLSPSRECSRVLRTVFKWVWAGTWEGYLMCNIVSWGWGVRWQSWTWTKKKLLKNVTRPTKQGSSGNLWYKVLKFSNQFLVTCYRIAELSWNMFLSPDITDWSTNIKILMVFHCFLRNWGSRLRHFAIKWNLHLFWRVPQDCDAASN